MAPTARSSSPASESGAQPASPAARFPGGLLAARGQWTLALGASQARGLQAAAAALLVLNALILLAWLAGLWADARAGHRSWPAAALACGWGAAWLRMAWRLWRSSRAVPEFITLIWGGLPLREPRGCAMTAEPCPQPLPAWSVRPWDVPVRVRLVFALGRWVLLDIASQAGSPVKRRAWCWIDAPPHHLRALLYSAAAKEPGAVPAQDPRADVTKMASWALIHRLWAAVFVSPSTTAPAQRGRSLPAARAAAVEKAFATTQAQDSRPWPQRQP